MSEPYSYEAAGNDVKALKKSQIINAYTVYLALSKKKNVDSLKDFCDLRFDVATELENLINFHEIEII